MELGVGKPAGWTTVPLPDDVEQVTVASGKTQGQLSLMLIGIRAAAENVYVQDVLEITGEMIATA